MASTLSASTCSELNILVSQSLWYQDMYQDMYQDQPLVSNPLNPFLSVAEWLTRSIPIHFGRHETECSRVLWQSRGRVKTWSNR